jgi:hypothetical protein
MAGWEARARPLLETVVPARPPTHRIHREEIEGAFPWTDSNIQGGYDCLVRMRYGLAYKYIARELPKELGE